jgi:hypothetical protein
MQGGNMKNLWIAVTLLLISNLSFADVITVISENGTPISGATVMVGNSIDDPFEGNQFTTDVNGNISVPSQWKSNLPISISAYGYVTQTHLDALPVSRSFEMSKAELPDSLELGGMTDGYGRLRRDGKLDVGLVMPTFSREDLLSFDISSVISPETDTLSVAGQSFEVPSNIAFPKQTERYFISFTLNKPQYRTYSRKLGPQQFVASHAQFPVKRVIDKIRRGDSILDVINDFTFKGGGLMSADLDSDQTSENVMVDEFTYDQEMSVMGGPFGLDKMQLSIAVSQNDGLLYPTDLKFIDAGDREALKTYDNGQERLIASMLTNRPENDVIDIGKLGVESPISLSESFAEFFGTVMNQQEQIEPQVDGLGQMSIAIQSEDQQGQPPQFLSLVAKPVVEDGALLLNPPATNDLVMPAMTLVVYSSIEEIQSGEITIEKRTRLWEIATAGWISRLDLPEVEIEEENASTHRRWEVIYLGLDRRKLLNEGLDEITHITRNLVDIK